MRNEKTAVDRSAIHCTHAATRQRFGLPTNTPQCYTPLHGCRRVGGGGLETLCASNVPKARPYMVAGMGRRAGVGGNEAAKMQVGTFHGTSAAKLAPPHG